MDININIKDFKFHVGQIIYYPTCCEDMYEVHEVMYLEIILKEEATVERLRARHMSVYKNGEIKSFGEGRWTTFYLHNGDFEKLLTVPPIGATLI